MWGIEIYFLYITRALSYLLEEALIGSVLAVVGGLVNQRSLLTITHQNGMAVQTMFGIYSQCVEAVTVVNEIGSLM